MVASVAITPTLFFVVSLAATLAPGFYHTDDRDIDFFFKGIQCQRTGCIAGDHNRFLRPVFCRNRTICLEYRMTVSLDLLP